MKNINLKHVSIAIISVGITACNSGSSENTAQAASGELSIMTNTNNVEVNQNLIVTIKLQNSKAVTKPVIIDVSSSDRNILAAVNTNTCQLTTKNPACEIIFDAKNAGNVNLITKAPHLYKIFLNNSITVTSPNKKYVFVSKSSPDGSMEVNNMKFPDGLNPIQKADYICNQDAKDTTWISTDKNATKMKWKAMLVDDANRQAKPDEKDWVLYPNVEYQDIISGTNLGKTNSEKAFDFKLTNIWGYGSPYKWDEYNNKLYIWTGLTDNWASNSMNCNGWTSTSDMKYGTLGLAITSDGNPMLYLAAINSVLTQCYHKDKVDAYALRLLCVQQ
ncbi:MAG: DUF1554 domain-containing protein [Burkholderiales bacterium]|nr:DUF1554 domain-containing protein [Burkholderiales bacterium]